jgi:putative oxygen-independent coproporphyrinogen III oxidase
MCTSLYIHIPFCTHRCGYCDFNTYAGLQRLIPAYSQAVAEEIEYLARKATERLTISTIYFGGGTPSLLSNTDLENILNTIYDKFNVQTYPEITIEANPGTVSQEYLNNIHGQGVNRLSLGMQSADPNELIVLERQHSFRDVVNAVEWAKSAGIDNVNLDLIFGLPTQIMNNWLNSLKAAVDLQPEHLSLYALTLEYGTPMQQKIEQGILPQLDDDMEADMYEMASEILIEAGYIQYEISNWARMKNPGEIYSCKHNLQYWRNLPYIGVGAGAHGYIHHFRTVDVLTPGIYIRRMKDNHDIQSKRQTFPRTPATTEMTPISTNDEIGETMMMGLRLVEEGVSDVDFQQRFGMSLESRFSEQIDRLISVGLVEWAGVQDKRLRITKRGRLLGNQVFKEFI